MEKSDLAIDKNSLIKAGMLNDEKGIGFWLDELSRLVNKGVLDNTKEDLIYYVTGVTDGWLMCR